MSVFIEIITKNVLWEEVKIFAGFMSRYDWGFKDITKNCSYCSYCIGQKEASVIVEMVNLNKGRCQWRPPSTEKVLGICIWGVAKILCPKENPRKCQYFNKED
jgi:hypothetical protein